MKALFFAFSFMLALSSAAQDTIYPAYKILGLDTFYRFYYDKYNVPYPVYMQTVASRECLEGYGEAVGNDSLCHIRGHIPNGGEPLCWSIVYRHEDTECCTLRYIEHGDEYHMCGRCMATFLFTEAYTDTIVIWRSQYCYPGCRSCK